MAKVESDALPRPGPISPRGEPVTRLTTLTPGAPLLVEWGGQWWQGEVLALKRDGLVRIHYTGWEDSWDEDLTRDRLRLPLDTRRRPIPEKHRLREGEPILVEWGGQWWQGELLAELGDGRLVIHYTGWEADWDEIVPRERVSFGD